MPIKLFDKSPNMNSQYSQVKRRRGRITFKGVRVQSQIEFNNNLKDSNMIGNGIMSDQYSMPNNGMRLASYKNRMNEDFKS